MQMLDLTARFRRRASGSGNVQELGCSWEGAELGQKDWHGFEQLLGINLWRDGIFPLSPKVWLRGPISCWWVSTPNNRLRSPNKSWEQEFKAFLGNWERREEPGFFWGHGRVTGPGDGGLGQQEARGGELRAMTAVSSVFVSFGRQFCACSTVGLFSRTPVWNMSRWWCRMEEEQCHISPAPRHGFLLDSSCLWSLGMSFYGLYNDAGEGILLLGCFFKEQSLPACSHPLLGYHPWRWCEQPCSHRGSAERAHFSKKRTQSHQKCLGLFLGVVFSLWRFESLSVRYQ